MTGDVTLEFCASEAACLDDLARLHGLCFAHPWPASEFGRLVEMPGAYALIARDGAEAVGFMLGRAAGDEAEIISIGVAPPCRRRGIATRLMSGSDDHLLKCAVASLFIEVDRDDGAAVGFYTAHGFAQVGLRPGYYRRTGGTRGDAVVMRRQLSCA